jgi:hypothetical protein
VAPGANVDGAALSPARTITNRDPPVCERVQVAFHSLFAPNLHDTYVDILTTPSIRSFALLLQIRSSRLGTLRHVSSKWLYDRRVPQGRTTHRAWFLGVDTYRLSCFDFASDPRMTQRCSALLPSALLSMWRRFAGANDDLWPTIDTLNPLACWALA